LNEEKKLLKVQNDVIIKIKDYHKLTYMKGMPVLLITSSIGTTAHCGLLACRKIHFHLSLSITNSLHLLTPVINNITHYWRFQH